MSFYIFEIEMEKNEQSQFGVEPTPLVHETWKGNHVFAKNKKSMTVRNENMPPVSLFILWVSYILHYAFIESMIVFSTYGLSTLILFVLNVYSTGNFWLAWTTEPGIIPRRKKLSSSIANTLNLSARAPYKQTLILQGRKREVYFCRSCNIYRPPRAQHCPVCNSCVERFDHHCPWVGNCIGQRNYRYFFRFLFSTFTYYIISSGLAALNLIQIESSIGTAAGVSPMSIVVIVLNVLISLFVGGLCVFHTYLSCTNQTTYDNVRGEEVGMYGIGLDLCYDLFYLREPTKVRGLDFEETLSSSSSEDSEDDTDEEPEEEDWETMNNRIISNLNGNQAESGSIDNARQNSDTRAGQGDSEEKSALKIDSLNFHVGVKEDGDHVADNQNGENAMELVPAEENETPNPNVESEE